MEHTSLDEAMRLAHTPTWDITVVQETVDGVTFAGPDGETAWLSHAEYREAQRKRARIDTDMENTHRQAVRVRFPNESYHDVIMLSRADFSPAVTLGEEVFGWLHGNYVAVNAEDWSQIRK